VISFSFSAISTSTFVVVADLNNKLSDNIQASIIVPIFLSISNQASVYILYKIEQVEQIGSILIFSGAELAKSILWWSIMYSTSNSFIFSRV
jgi:hypothetical protein